MNTEILRNLLTTMLDNHGTPLYYNEKLYTIAPSSKHKVLHAFNYVTINDRGEYLMVPFNNCGYISIINDMFATGVIFHIDRNLVSEQIILYDMEHFYTNQENGLLTVECANEIRLHVDKYVDEYTV